MQNIKTHIVVGVVGDSKPNAEFEILYIGISRREARGIYLANKRNKDFDFVGMQTMNGFKSRARPKVDAANEVSRAAAMAVRQEEEVTKKANKAQKAKEALGEAALRAEVEELEAREKLEALRAKASEQPDDDDDNEPDEDELVFVGDDELAEALAEEEGGVEIEDDEVDDDEDLAELIANEEEKEKNEDA